MPTLRERIVALLLDKPLTTAQVQAALGGLAYSKAWSTLYRLKESGLIDSTVVGRQPKRIATWRIADRPAVLKLLDRTSKPPVKAPPLKPLDEGERAAAVREEIYRARTRCVREYMR